MDAIVLGVATAMMLTAFVVSLLGLEPSPAVDRMPLRAWTALCAVNFTALVSMGWPA